MRSLFLEKLPKKTMQIRSIFYVFVSEVRSSFPYLEKIDGFLLDSAHKGIAQTAHAEAEKALAH